MKKFKGIFKDLDAKFCVIFLAVMMVAATLQIVARYFFKASLMWTDELCRFMLVWASFLSISCAVRYDSHLFVDILPKSVTEHKIFSKILLWIRTIIWVGFAVYFGKLGMDTVLRVVELSQALYIPLKLIYLAIPVGSWLMALFVLIDAIKKTFGKAPAQPDAPKTEEGGN